MGNLGMDKLGVESDDRKKDIRSKNKQKFSDNPDLKSVNQKDNKSKTKSLNKFDNVTKKFEWYFR